MLQHIRANVWLLVLSVLLSWILYPLVLWGIGQGMFPFQANGSMIRDGEGHPLGSKLIGQPFKGDEYFQPRPSATSPAYNAAASSGSNLAASNPLLRARVAQQLGPIVKYGPRGPRPAQRVGPDIDRWFQNWSREHPGETGGVVARWAETYPSVAAAWVKQDKPYGNYVQDWQKAHPDAVRAFVRDRPENPEPKPEDMAADFFKAYAREHPGAWPSYGAPEGQTRAVWHNIREGSEIQSYFFDMWRQEHPDVDLEPVPGDMVMSSGSGLDPDITLKNARWQLDNRVARAWADKTRRNEREIHDQIARLLDERKWAPLGGLVGVDLINVLELNLALRERFEHRR